MREIDRRGIVRQFAATVALGLCVALGGGSPVALGATSILAVGDSITEGTMAHDFSADEYPESAYRRESGGSPSTLLSYREHLHDLLTDEACDADIDWVGARRANGRLPSTHEGHGGWHAAYFDELAWRDANGRHDGERNLAGWLPVLAPDVVTLHLGTNGLGRTRSAAANARDIEGLLDDIFDARPPVRVYLANVIPISGWWGDRATTLADARSTVREEAQVLTGLIGNLASEQAARGRDVVLVDVNSEFYIDESNPTTCPAATGGDPNNMTMTVCVPDPVAGDGRTIPDGLHPNLKGDRFVAERFLAAMRASGGICAASSDGPPSEPVSTSGPEEAVVESPTEEPAMPEEPIETEEPGEIGAPDRADDGGMPDPAGEPVAGDGDAEPVVSGPADDADAREVEALLRLLANWRHGR